MSESKPLLNSDESGFLFAREMLAGDPTAAINFDRLQKHPRYGYIIFEYLLCDEAQEVTPWTSHPNRYWNKNARKFIRLWGAAQELHAALFLVNYARAGTRHAEKILLIRVMGIGPDGITRERSEEYTRQQFSNWFRQLNKECLS